jgi:hypothetical protein
MHSLNIYPFFGVSFVHDSAIKDKLQCASREHVSRVKAPNVMPLLKLHFKKLMNH